MGRRFSGRERGERGGVMEGIRKGEGGTGSIIFWHQDVM